MLAVRDDVRAVDNDLDGGVLACPGCGGQLGPWGWARPREVRGSTRLIRRPRRSRCRACRATHVLVPTSTLWRRRDAVEVIGAALVAKHAGQGHRRIATELGVPASTAQGWLRRFAANAERHRATAILWAAHLGAADLKPQPRGSPFADALEALGLAAAGAIRHLGPARSSWHLLSALTGARLLAP